MSLEPLSWDIVDEGLFKSWLHNFFCHDTLSKSHYLLELCSQVLQSSLESGKITDVNYLVCINT